MTTFISYARKSPNATILKPSPEHWVRIESSDVLAEMSPTPRGATIDENWKGTAGTEVIAQIICSKPIILLSPSLSNNI